MDLSAYAGETVEPRTIWMTQRSLNPAVADIVPKMTELEGYGDFTNPRLIYNLGHAVFEFIEARWGKEGVRRLLKEGYEAGIIPHEVDIQFVD